MAIQLISAPTAVNSAHQCVEWCFKMDDIGDESIQKMIGYQLKDIDGNEITIPESYRPASIDEIFCLDFTEDVMGLVTTMMPEIDPPGGSNDTYVFHKIILYIWEVIQDGCDITETSPIPMEQVTIINGVLQEYEQDIFGDPENKLIFLTHQPLITRQCRNAKNYLWVFGGGTTVTYSTPGQSDIFLSPSSDAYYLPLYIKDIFPAVVDTAVYFEISFADSSRVYRIYLEECCCDDDYLNILYLDPKGGRSLISFECNNEYKFDTSQRIINRNSFCNVTPAVEPDAINKFNIGGKTIINKESVERFTLVKTVEYDKENIEWAKAFLSSIGYHIQMVIDTGQTTFRKFVVDAGSYVIREAQGEVDMVVSGFISHPYKTQFLDR